MNVFDVLLEQTDDKVAQLKEHLADGKALTFEEYKRLCGEIRGLLLARGYIIDLQQKTEYADE